MIWLTWRQHRAEVLGAAALLAILGTLALITGIPMYRAYQQDGVAACLDGSQLDNCGHIIDTFRSQFGGLPLDTAGQLNFLPLVAGLLVGAPLLAREHENGTWQLAWTQAVPRTRWLVAKLGLVLGAVATVAILLSALLGWWLQPLIESPFRVESFNYSAPVLTGYLTFAVAVGILAGALIKRVIPAMVATLAVILPIRLAVEFWLRPRFMTPVTAVDPTPGSGTLTDRISAGKDWILDRFLVGTDGRRLTDAEEFDILGGGQVDDAMLAEHGLREGVSYHPADRFWDFQLIEAGIFVGLALIAVLLTVWRVRRW
jgi:uncharacterized membrane protein